MFKSFLRYFSLVTFANKRSVVEQKFGFIKRVDKG